MRTLLEKTLDLAFGAAALTREKAQELVDDLVRRGEAAREESGTLVEDILRRGQKQREELQAVVQREVTEALIRVNIATREDLSRLERRIQELEAQVEDLRAGSSGSTAPAQPEIAVVPPETPPASKSEAQLSAGQ